MQTKTSNRVKVEQDYRLFFVFMTLIMVGMYVVSLIENPALQKFWPAALFTILLTAHITLHWIVIRLIQTPVRKAAYIIGQGLLAFVIIQMSGNIGMIFALYMALIGECIGILGITRWAALTVLFYMALSVSNFGLFADTGSAFFWLLASIPTIIFVSLYVTLYTRQAEARERAQALADELSEYVAKVEDLTIANERQRMARELHDTLSQGLAGLVLQLEAADAHLSNKHPERAQEIIQQSMETARSVLGDARKAISDLRHESGELEDSLRLEIFRFTEATGIPCNFHLALSQPIADSVRETVIRAVAESLNNIARHAKAASSSVSVTANENEITVDVKDDGIGFDPNAIASGHYGLLGMQERARLNRGRLEVRSEAGKGTHLTLTLPIESK
ncbi:MAG: sensor histidine kinase [Chloroflexi bacterium]|nr:sensor histidine kinase [Chloroflexota bacterium]